MTVELISPFFPTYFLHLACFGTICRSLCGISAGATRASLMQHFAITNNVSDISAKENIQETFVTLFGLVCGLYCTTWLDNNVTGTWIVFIVLTVIHVWANMLAMR